MEHAALTRFLMLVLLLLGVSAYFQLGQDEDPPFTFRAMVVRSYSPGATAQQVAEQGDRKIERTLQEVPRSPTKFAVTPSGASRSIIFQLRTRPSPAEQVRGNVWYSVRKKVGDMRGTLP